MRIIPYKTKLDHNLQLFKHLNTLPIRILFIYTTLKTLFDKSGESKLFDFRRLSRLLYPNQILQYSGSFIYF